MDRTYVWPFATAVEHVFKAMLGLADDFDSILFSALG
jgi:hypothetical protein